MQAEGQNPGLLFETGSPDYATLHPGYETGLSAWHARTEINTCSPDAG
jgi:hypothetical protein